MKLGWYWTVGTSAFQRYYPSNLIQPSSPCCLLLSHAMGLHADLLRLLPQILRSKAATLTRVGQAIEFRVCAQRCVCVGGLVWSRTDFPSSTGVRRRHRFGRLTEEDRWLLPLPCFITTSPFPYCRCASRLACCVCVQAWSKWRGCDHERDAGAAAGFTACFCRLCG